MMGKKIDLTGQRFSRLLVLEDVGRDKRGRVLWKCSCSCGNETVVYSNNLIRGATKSCGCLQKESVSETKKINLIGQKFDRLLVLEETGRNKSGAVLWKCFCDCGNEIVVIGCHLRSGNTKSCGCLNEELKRLRCGKDSPTYNPNLTDEERQDKRKHPEYNEWRTAVFERDNYICQCCNMSGGKLVAHHLESYINNLELRIILGNGITLCEECHKNFHHWFGYGNNTREQLEEFFLAQKKLIGEL